MEVKLIDKGCHFVKNTITIFSLIGRKDLMADSH